MVLLLAKRIPITKKIASTRGLKQAARYKYNR